MNQIGFFKATSYDAAGSITIAADQDFIVPNYATSLVVTVRGAGGGGGGGGINSNSNGGTGGLSKFAATSAGYGSDLVANGGVGGQGNENGRAGGAGGTATGGSTNTTGTAGSTGTNTSGGVAIGGAGGAGAGGGGAGGAQVGPTSGQATGNSGTAAGGGGSGGIATGPGGGGGGGGGGLSARTFTVGQVTPAAVVRCTIGVGGSRGSGWRDGGLGARGEITISWS